MLSNRRRAWPGVEAFGRVRRVTRRTLAGGWPSHRTLSAVDAAALFGGEWLPTVPERHYAPPAPVMLAGDPEVFGDVEGRLPARGVLTLPGGSVVGEDGWILAPDKSLVSGLSLFALQPQWIPWGLVSFTSRQRLRGRALSLVSCWSAGNYCHFVYDSLARLSDFQAAGGTLDDVEHVLLPGFRSPSAERLVRALGIPAAKIVVPPAHGLVTADELVVPTPPGVRDRYEADLAGFLRATTQQQRPHRRLFALRHRPTTRALVNQEAIARICEERGFELIDPGRAADSASQFASATHVIGAHGANLVDVAYCRPGTKVLEIVNPNHPRRHYYTMASTAGMAYHAAVGVSTRPRSAQSPHPNDITPLSADSADFVVDEIDFTRALSRFLEGSDLQGT